MVSERLLENDKSRPQTMNKRPRSVIVISWLFVAAGVVGFVYHTTEFTLQGPLQYGLVWVCFLRLLAIVCGVFMLRGSNSARWLLLAWIAYHVILSASHTLSEFLVHSLLFAVVAYFLFSSAASAYFRRASGEAAQLPETNDTPAT